ncbi:hypothetical protein GHR28_04995 [Escherichia coli]|jgi:hypothetical protein|uniref:hypothetical protein n=1 Tax=Escherichia coli TaxID=562 RepID=UPI000BE55735|nr:hypothetical protein [Escherichia coli]EFH8448841.1 hypothetical protein [Escherichia coli]ELX1905608.1 hypothetical protein [Escherichia coli]MCH6389571.1 hypothetical protein [Escherichia coli]HCJ9348208.1 hypothetical protein [Escherichia coli]HCJ9425091.1 hypothetical protein [Escherichia coli]
MSIVEIIIGVIGAICVAAASGFGLGHIHGTSKAEAKADQQRTEENAAAMKKAADRCVEVIKETRDVQENVSRMPDDDVDRELRENFTRPGGD